MSLRKSPNRTPELLQACQRNAAHSTGPRSPAAKGHVKMNALKHGIYAAPENESDVMRALGEDPQEYNLLKSELALTYGPGDPLWMKQLEDLGRLYWRQKRIERMQTGLMRRALREVEARQEQRAVEMAAATFDASRVEMLELDLPEPVDAGVRARLRLSCLGLIRAQVQEARSKNQEAGSENQEAGAPGGAYVPASFAGMYAPGASAPAEGRIHPDKDRRDVCATQLASSFAGIAPAATLSTVLEYLYRGRLTWRAVRMRKLLRALEAPGPALEPEEALRAELLALLAEEIAAAREEWEAAEKQHREDAALERDACLAPVGATWETLLRGQAALDRSIDRKVRIILAMRKDYTRLLRMVAKDPRSQLDHQQAQELNTLLGLDLPFEDTQDENLVEAAKAAEQRTNVAENKESGS